MPKIIELILKTIDNVEIKTLTFDIKNDTTINDIYNFVNNIIPNNRTEYIEIVLDGLKRKLKIKNSNIKLTEIYYNLFGDDIINEGDEIHIIYDEMIPELIKLNI